MKAGELIPAAYNPRIISDVKLQALKKSMGELGDISGFVYNHQTGNLVGGHQRLKCIPSDAVVTKKRLAEATKAGTVAEGSIMVDGERWNYREVNWPLSREKLANIAANKHGGDWEEDKLKEIMAELKNDSAVDIDLSGFGSVEIDEMLAGYDAGTDKGVAGEDNEKPASIVQDKDDNIIIRISVNPGMWLGKRDAILQTLEKLKKVYCVEYSIKE